MHDFGSVVKVQGQRSRSQRDTTCAKIGEHCPTAACNI